MTESSSRDAHAESNAHHASVCKACALASGAGTAGSCQATERLARVELGLKRLHLAVWITLVVLIIVLAFVAGQRTQSKNAMMQGRPNENGNIGRRNPLGPNGMPGSMRGMNGKPNGNGKANGNFEVRIERYENDNDDGPNDDQEDGDRDYGKPKKRMSNDGAPNQNLDKPPQPPMPPTGAK